MRVLLSTVLLLCAAVTYAQDTDEMCTVDGVAPDPASQNKVDKFIQRFQGRPVTKALRKLIMRKLKDKSSGLSKMLGKLAQDPKDENFEEGDLDVSEPANPGLMKMLSKVLGETRTVVGYLWSFGFFAKILNKSPRQADNYNGTIPPCAITKAVMEFQTFNQLPADGKLTKKTRELMALDRCGNPDVKCETEECKADEEAEEAEGGGSGIARKKRYALYSRKWKAKEMDLTYFFYNYTSDMPVEKCRFEIEKGLREWTDVSPFSFTEVDNPDDAKFKIFFANRDHFDGHQFDGPWGVLAHAFYPRKGKLHYDDDETFTADTPNGVNLYYATTHEMGHGLGLMHSSSYGAVMAPYYPGYRDDIQLSQDDLDGIHKNYGTGKGKVTPLANWRELGQNKYVDNEAEGNAGKAKPLEGPGNLEYFPPGEEPQPELKEEEPAVVKDEEQEDEKEEEKAPVVVEEEDEVEEEEDEVLDGDEEEKPASEGEKTADAADDICTVDGVAPDPASQNKVDKFIQRFQGRPVTKILRKLIMNKLKDKSSGLSKMLGKLAQDPKDENFEEGDLDVSEPANPGLMKMLSKVLGETRTVVGYLWSFGFFAKILNKSPRQADNYNGTIPPCAITKAVMEFQTFNQLPADGKLTKKTRELMALDRCGNPDVKCETEECQADEEAAANEGEDGGLARKKRYALYSRKWKAKEMDLTYFFYNYTSDMPVAKCRSEIEKGLREWTDVSPFSFTEVDNPDDAKFKIFFANRDHFDGHQFDGPWGVLAHAFYPRKGKLHYDDDETFTADTPNGVNLYYATTHEMGHGLGLMHSSSYGAVMAPYYPGYRDDIQLSQDDLDAIHENYGNGKGKVTPLANWESLGQNQFVDNEAEGSEGRAKSLQGDGPDNLEFPAPVTEKPAPKVDEEVKPEPEVKPEEEVKVKKLEPFKEEETDEMEEEEAGPTPEGDGPGNLEQQQTDCIERIDAAVNSPLEKYAFIFSGGKYVRLEPDEKNMPVLSEGYPKAVSDGFPGLPDKIQAGFTDFDKKVSYFFVGGLVYSWDWVEDKVVMKGLAIEQTEFNGLPDDISGVASYRDHVIFINDEHYYLWTSDHGLLPGENVWPFQGDNVMHVTGAFNAFLNGYFYTSIDEMPEKYVLFRARTVMNGNPGGAANPTYSYRKFVTDMNLDICAN